MQRFLNAREATNRFVATSTPYTLQVVLWQLLSSLSECRTRLDDDLEGMNVADLQKDEKAALLKVRLSTDVCFVLLISVT